MNQQNLDPNQPKRFYEGKSRVAKQKGRDAHGRFVSGETIQQQQELAQKQKFGMLLGSGFNRPQEQMGQPQQNSAEEHIQNMFGLRKMRR
jgi:hypothetical protein